MLEVKSAKKQENKVIPFVFIKWRKGNIPINKELFCKYSSAREMFNMENNDSNCVVVSKTNIFELENIDFNNIKINDLKRLANIVFSKYSFKTILNNQIKIVVNKSGINESVEKIFNNRVQRNLLKEHLYIFANLGHILEKAELCNQAFNQKTNLDINYWNYYFAIIIIARKKYKIVFDVRSMQDGTNQYRVQRLEYVKTVSYDGDI